LRKRINQAGELLLSCDTNRSQLKNRNEVEERFFSLIKQALKPVKKRHATVPTPASRKKRIEAKKIHSEKKARRKPGIED